MKPTVPGIPASDSIAIVIGQASHGLAGAQTGEPEMSSPSARSCCGGDDDRERGHVHQQVDGQVQDGGVDARAGCPTTTPASM